MSIYDDKPWLSLYDANVSAEITPRYEDALAMFKAAVQHVPERAAIHYFEHSLSYAEVDRLTDALAAGFQRLGLHPRDRVAIYLQNVPQFILSLVATWKAGGIAVSCNPMLRQRELRSILADSGATLLVALEPLFEEIAREAIAETEVRHAITTSALDFLQGETPALLADVRKSACAGSVDLLELIEEHRDESPSPVVLTADDVALLTYTSGTTGPPKGAMNTHGNVVFGSQLVDEWIGLRDRDVVLAMAPLFHITGLIGHVGCALFSAIPLVLHYRFDPVVAAQMVERYRITYTVGAITAFIALMNTEAVENYDLTSLKKVYSGGAPVPVAAVDAFRDRFGIYIHNGYGMTETTAGTHLVPYQRTAPVDEETGVLSVGVPLCNVVVRVIDDAGNDLPAGEIGQLATTGPMVVPGYWQNAEQTAHALPGGSMRTGDVGFMDADGWFYVVDRSKDMIVASGYKVWPREVEDVLYAHPAVREVAVSGVPDDYRGESVKAFVSLKVGQDIDPADLREFCKDKLAAYKRPRELEVLEELPKNASGKILRRELRASTVAKDDA